MQSPRYKKVAVIGGGGYVGSALVPHLLERGYDIKVIDLFLFGKEIFNGVRNRHLACVEADVRNEVVIRKELEGMDAVIHLACISNDPSFELDPELGKSINYEAFPGFLQIVKATGIKRFIYASSSSVYGVKDQPDVREDTPCDPLTDYSKYKLLCESLISRENWKDNEYVILRPATVCGYASRLRLDLSVNILTINALVKKEITVFGGNQLRPNINMRDMIEVYRVALEAPREKIHGQIFNAGYENLTIMKIAEMVKKQVGDESIRIRVQPTNDARSYHVNSDKIRQVLGFQARYTVEEAIESLCKAYRAGKIKDPLSNSIYYNIKTMQNINIKSPLKRVALL
jgi:nucleoside-diphosphate-sugar epimerase